MSVEYPPGSIVHSGDPYMGYEESWDDHFNNMRKKYGRRK